MSKFSKNQQKMIIDWIEKNPNKLNLELTELIQDFDKDNFINKLDKILIIEWSSVEYTMLDVYYQFIDMFKSHYPNSTMMDNLFDDVNFVNKLEKYVKDDSYNWENEKLDNIEGSINYSCEGFLADVNLTYDEMIKYFNFSNEDYDMEKYKQRTLNVFQN